MTQEGKERIQVVTCPRCCATNYTDVHGIFTCPVCGYTILFYGSRA